MFQIFKNKKKYNLIYILLDQFRVDALDSHKVFDEIKKKSVFMDNLITYAPYTLASCHAVFSGLYGNKNGVNGYTKSNNFDSKNIVTLTEFFKKNGFKTFAHTFSEILIPKQGFDEIEIIREDNEVDSLLEHQRFLCQSIEKSRNSNYFIFLHYGGIHHSVRKNVIHKFELDDPEYFDIRNRKANEKRYRKYTNKAGEYLEKVLETINQFDTSETIIYVTTDHGGSIGEKIGEKAYGSYLYDYSIKIWGHFLLPKEISILTRYYHHQLRTIDLYPSFCYLCNCKIPPKYKRKLQGMNIFETSNFSNLEEGLVAYAETGGVHSFFPSPHIHNLRCVRYKNWKLIQNLTTNKFELYDLSEDPQEEVNLFKVNQTFSEKMINILIDYSN